MKLNIEEFKQHYIACLLWSSMDDNDTPLDHNWTAQDLSQDALDQIHQDCHIFLYNIPYYISVGLVPVDTARLAYDFWLTRNGHGAGFWDGDWRDDIGADLTKLSKSFSHQDPYVGDDGEIYL